MENTTQTNAWYLVFAAWLIALISTLGSLFFSEIMHFPPCSLCWYQRIFMYPLVFVLFAGLFPVNKSVFKFSIPLVVTGFLISIYHNLLQLEIIPETAAPCREGISCSAKYIEWAGFVTIPLLSFISFSILLTILIIFYKKFYKEL